MGRGAGEASGPLSGSSIYGRAWRWLWGRGFLLRTIGVGEVDRPEASTTEDEVGAAALAVKEEPPADGGGFFVRCAWCEVAWVTRP